MEETEAMIYKNDNGFYRIVTEICETNQDFNSYEAAEEYAEANGEKCWLSHKQLKLLLFVQHAHASVSQVRKYTNEPYWVHPYAVAKIVSTITDGEDLIEIALLHDVVEDTKVSIETICKFLHDIGYAMLQVRNIERGVLALTDVYTHENFDHMNRTLRKQFEANRLKKIHKDYQTVKYADLIDNTKSIVQHDKNFARKYLEEKRYLLNVMRDGDLWLFFECYKVLTDAELTLTK